jgi:translation initiation factor 3 subunit E
MAKFFFECGQYNEAAEQLKYFRAINTDSAKDLKALWGKLCADIVMTNWSEASKGLAQLRDLIESPQQKEQLNTPIKLLQQRAWYVHWSLFVHFPMGQNGLNNLLDQFVASERLLSAIQNAAPWIFRYCVIASVIMRTKQKELSRVLDLESYSDPIVAFFKALYGKYNFEEAEKQLELCIPVLQNDYFISGHELKYLKDDFIKAGKFAICEAYCTIHQTIDIALMTKKLGLPVEDSEACIVNFIRQAKLDAKIDTANNLVRVQPKIPSAYQQTLDKTKLLMLRAGVSAAPSDKSAK